MNDVNIYTASCFNSMKEYEAQNMSYSVFENIDFHQVPYTISFFRSDFRGAKFQKVLFYKNNLDRADFLNSIFIECSFDKINFGCCQMKNCYFENVSFTNNFYRNTSIHSCTFKNCKFPDEKFLINMQRCRLVNCDFIGCDFEMSTTDSDEFENCKFIDTNLATMHAENHNFIKCTFRNTFFDSSYYFGYFISKCSLHDVYFLYRGEYVDFKDINCASTIQLLRNEHRYNDLINVLKYNHEENKIIFEIKEGIQYFSNYHYGRMLELNFIFKTLILSALYEELDFEVLYNILSFFQDEKWETYSSNEKIEIGALIQKLQNSLFVADHSYDYLSSINLQKMSALTVQFESDDLDECLNNAQRFINDFSNIEYWKLIDKKQGSWFLTFAVPTVVLLSILPSVIKKYADVYFDIKVKRVLSKKLLSKLDSTRLSTDQIKNIESAIHLANLTMAEPISDHETIGEFIKSIRAEI